MRVFISYPSKDGKNYAQTLYDVLKKHGHDPFLADHGLFSENIWDEIADELEKRERKRLKFNPPPTHKRIQCACMPLCAPQTEQHPLTRKQNKSSQE